MVSTTVSREAAVNVPATGPAGMTNIVAAAGVELVLSAILEESGLAGG